MKSLVRKLAAVTAVSLATLFLACSSTHKDNSPPPGSNDILDLLTGFGESVSKRDFVKAVGYLTPSERALMLNANGQVPEDKQKALAALHLSRLIRMPGVHVENGYLAGIYDILPNDREAPAGSAEESATAESTDGSAASEAPAEEMAAEEGQRPPEGFGAPKDDPELKQAVNKFFKAISQKNWNAALAMMNEDERKVLLDDRGKLKENAKSRLQNMDSNGKEALTLQDGKLTGVTLLLPAD